MEFNSELIEEFGYGYDNEEEEAPQSDPNKDLLGAVNVYSEIDKKFDNIYKDVIKTNDNFLYSSKVQNLDIENLAKELTKKNSKGLLERDSTKLERDQKKLLNASANDFLKNTQDFSVPKERQNLYELYEEIPNVNHIAYRMLRVYIDNIFIKNAQTKQFINIKPNQDNQKYLEGLEKNIKSTSENWLKTFMIYFNLQTKLKNKIIPGMLKNGNQFLEILDLNELEENVYDNIELIQEDSKLFSTKKSREEINNLVLFEHNFGDLEKNKKTKLLEESSNEDKDNKKTGNNSLKDLLKRQTVPLEENSAWLNDIFKDDESEFKLEEIENIDFDSMENIYLQYVHPKDVIIIEKNNITFGYLIIDEETNKQQTKEINLYERFAKAGEKKYKKGTEGDVVDSVIDDIILNLNKGMEDIISSSFNTEKDFGIPKELAKSIKMLVYQRIKEKAELKFRFVSTNHMVNFTGPQDKYGNYGTSIFDPIIMPVKLYTLALMSSIISRLSRASVVRKWNIEAGNRKNHAEIMDQVKKDINNKSISFDNLSNIKNINNVLTDFRDMATIQVNGQKFIDMEIMPMHDRALPMNDMQDLRNELVTATGIPSVYLNIGDNTELRETLVNLNTSFANTISSYQDLIEEGMSNLINNVFRLILKHNNRTDNQFQLTNFFTLQLNNPLILELQSSEALISSVTNIIGLLKSSEMIVDPRQIFEMYIPQIDWETLEQGGQDFIKKQGKEMILQNDAQNQGQ